MLTRKLSLSNHHVATGLKLNPPESASGKGDAPQGPRADASLGPWVEDPTCCNPEPQPADKPANNGFGSDMDALDACALPDDLTLDFEAFLNDTNLLGGGQRLADPISSDSLFPELFA